MAMLMIRNLDDEIDAKLKTMASNAERSKEAEARMALRHWVEGHSMSNWQKEITNRIRHALDLFASPERVQRGTDFLIPPARLAEGIGENLVGPVQGWIEGTHEPSITQIKAVARWCRVDEVWLMSGEGTPYRVKDERIPENPGEGAMALLAGQNDGITTLKALRFFRVEGVRGNLSFLRHYQDGSAQVFTTPYVVPGDLAGETGGGGRSSLKSLLLTWEMLYAIYTRSSRVPGLMISSHVIPEDLDRRLRQGNENPLALVERLRAMPWWEDIWNDERASKSNYWLGWSQTTEELLSEIENDQRAASLRKQIRDLTDDKDAFDSWLFGTSHTVQP